MKQTQHEFIFNYLTEMKGWVPSYALSKTRIGGGWVGSRGERSARDFVSSDCPKKFYRKVERLLGKDLLEKKVTKDAIGNLIGKKYAYYHVK